MDLTGLAKTSGLTAHAGSSGPASQRGKSSTDINPVLDAMDALSGNVGIEEFFIASADADFTSLTQRFRAADRMTTVIAAGAVAFAYREMADHVVESHDFVAILNGTTVEPVHAVASLKQPDAPVAKAKTKAKAASPAIREVLELVRAAPGPVVGAGTGRLGLGRQAFFQRGSARARRPPAGHRTELSGQVRDDCVNADQPVSRNAVSFVLQGLAYVNFPHNDEATPEGLAAAWTANVEELCRVALLEFDAAQKLAVRRWASGGLLDN